MPLHTLAGLKQWKRGLKQALNGKKWEEDKSLGHGLTLINQQARDCVCLSLDFAIIPISPESTLSWAGALPSMPGAGGSTKSATISMRVHVMSLLLLIFKY